MRIYRRERSGQRLKAVPRALLVGLALTLVLAACGDSDDDVEPAGAEQDGEGEDPDDEDEEVAEGDFYDGERFEVLIAHGTGGGTDIQGRFLADWITEKLPGDVSNIVDNVSGGGTMIGANEMAMRDADGFNLWFSSASTTFPYLFDDPAVNFDFNDYYPLVGVPAGAVVYGRPEAGEMTDQQDTFITANQDPSGNALVMLLGYDILEIDHQPVFGYSSGERVIAVEQGEVMGAYATVGQYQELVQPLEDEGTVQLHYTAGMLEDGEVVRDPAWPDLPSIADVYEDIHGSPPSGDAWEAYKTLLSSGYSLQKIFWIPRDAPQQAIDEMKAAAQELADDPEFQAEAEEILEYQIIVGDELERAVEDMLDVDPEQIAWIQDFLESEYDVEN
jgi:hypothetical protein